MLTADIGGDAVLHLALRLQHGLLIIDQQRLQLRVLHPNRVGDLAIVQHRPLERRPKGEDEALGTEHIAQAGLSDIAAHRAEAAGQDEGGIQVRLGDADLRALGHGA